MKQLVLVAALTVFTASTSAPQVTIQALPVRITTFDVRIDKSVAAADYMDRLVPSQSAQSSQSSQSSQSALGMTRLKMSFNGLSVINNPELGTAEVVRVRTGSSFLTAPSPDRVTAMRSFLSSYSDAYGLSTAQAAKLELVAEYRNPSGNLAWVELEQKINGLPVFRGSVRGAFTAAGELVQTTGTLASQINEATLSKVPSLSGADAVSAAAANVGWKVASSSLVEKSMVGGVQTFARGPMAEDAKTWLMYFPLASGVARLAWAAEIWGSSEAFFVLLDAEDGTVLFRKNLTSYQSQPATYVVYTSDSPAPLSPTTVLPGPGTQAPFVPRQSVTLIGNEAPNTFNSLGWMTDGSNITDGNNVQAGLDRDGTNGVDSSVTGTGRVFDFSYNPQTDTPENLAYQRGEVTDMFFWSNVYHDRLYRLGFTEAAGNFQNDNFGRGGVAGDRISAESQDSGSNNANFSTSVDGTRGRMQMFIFTGPNPDRSSGLDHDVVLHELTHGTSNRLHGNGLGLTSKMSAGMGEGWSDFYARALLSTADEDPNGVFAVGAWVSNQLSGFSSNYYYGFRRFPYATISTTGANGRPHNPLTFADIDALQISTNDGAFPKSPISTSAVFEEHNVGEVWASALFEVRARFINRLGFDVGNERILQFVTDGMKLDPANPTFIEGRDSILAAANAGGGTAADLTDIWSGFAARGMGAGASVSNAEEGTVTESFDTPGIGSAGVSLITESIPNGRLDPNESATASFCITNSGFADSGDVTGSLSAVGLQVLNSPQSYGTIPTGGTVCRNFDFIATGLCGRVITPIMQAAVSGAATKTLNYSLRLGSAGPPSFSENFDSVVVPALPSGWKLNFDNGFTASPWSTDGAMPDSPPNHAFVANLPTTHESTLDAPFIKLATGGQVTFRHFFNLEPFFDGGVLELAIGTGSSFQDILAAGGTFVTGGYNGTIVNGKLLGRKAWTGDSGGYITTTVDLPSASVGQTNRLRWRIGTDSNTAAVGWGVDNIAVSPFQCSGVPAPDLTSLSPGGIAQGTFEVVTLNGNNFINGGTTIAVSGTGILNGGYTFVSSTSLLTQFVIDHDAPLGTRNVTVTTAGGTSNTLPFMVLLPVPRLFSVTPSFGLPGTAVAVTFNGTSLVPGTTVAVSGSGVTVSDINVVSGISLTATFTIAPGTPPSALNVTVTTPGGTSTPVTFNVFDPFPDLSITSSHTGNFGSGFNEVYSLLVTNVSTLPTTGTITVSDFMPTAIGSFVSASGGGFTCTANSTFVTCTRSTALAAGASATITLTLAVQTNASLVVVNNVSVSTAGDLNPANNSSADSTLALRAPVPTFSLTPNPVLPGGQATLGLTIIAFPHTVSGTLTMTVTPAAGPSPVDDPATQFATGGRVVSFTIDANTTEARFAGAGAGPIGFQPGSVATRIAFTGTLTSGTVQSTFTSNASLPGGVIIGSGPPAILSTQSTAQPGGFTSTITLLATNRSVTSVTLTFNTVPAVSTSCGSVTACSASGSTIVLNMSSLMNAWYASQTQFGSLASIQLPFTTEGPLEGTIAVKLGNAFGFSNTVSINIP